MAATSAKAQWQHHGRTEYRGTLALTAMFLLSVVPAWALWGIDAAITVGSFCGIPVALVAGLTVYSMGPRSGWRGLWTIRVFREVDDVSRRLDAALANAGRAPHRAPDRFPSRWLRVAGPPVGSPLELPNGTLFWLLMHARGRPTDPPRTEIVLQPPENLDPVELEFLKAAVLSAMQPAYDAAAA